MYQISDALQPHLNYKKERLPAGETPEDNEFFTSGELDLWNYYKQFNEPTP